MGVMTGGRGVEVGGEGGAVEERTGTEEVAAAEECRAEDGKLTED